MTDPRGPVHLSGELSLEVDGAGVQVHADGADVRIVAEDVGAFVTRVREAATARTGVAPGRRDWVDWPRYWPPPGSPRTWSPPHVRWPSPVPASTRRPGRCCWAPGGYGPARPWW
jgi:hypothetical protein